MTEELNPPAETPTGDPNENVDLGFQEDRENERDAEEDRAVVRRPAGDPLELDRPEDRQPDELDEYDRVELDQISPEERGVLRAEAEDSEEDPAV